MAWCRMSNQSVSIRSHGWAVSQKLPRHYNGHHSCKQLVSMRQLRVAAKGGHSLQSVILSKRRSKSWDIRPSLPSCPTSVLSLSVERQKIRIFICFKGNGIGVTLKWRLSALCRWQSWQPTYALLSLLSLSLFSSLIHSLISLSSLSFPLSFTLPSLASWSPYECLTVPLFYHSFSFISDIIIFDFILPISLHSHLCSWVCIWIHCAGTLSILLLSEFPCFFFS